MDISSIIKKLDISAFKVFFLRIFGGAEAVYEYIAEKANTAINALMEAHGEKVQDIRGKLATINQFLCKYTDYLPNLWLPYARALNNAIYEVYVATSDNNISAEERKAIIDRAKLAYSEFAAD